jgi:hypothetical protein
MAKMDKLTTIDIHPEINTKMNIRIINGSMRKNAIQKI